MGKVALITGVTGQDGSFLSEFLIEKGYEVHGIVRRSSTEKRERIDHIFEKWAPFWTASRVSGLDTDSITVAIPVRTVPSGICL